MKRLILTSIAIAVLAGCTTMNSVSNAVIPQCRTEECAQMYGKEDPKEVKRISKPITSEDVGEFALGFAINMGLWSAGLPDLDGNVPPKFNLE
ncbi:MAG: hypothetical protein ABIK45_10540 [Pseudomonadota bacterium]